MVIVHYKGDLNKDYPELLEEFHTQGTKKALCNGNLLEVMMYLQRKYPGIQTITKFKNGFNITITGKKEFHRNSAEDI